jgi:hypothetical protein
MHRPPNMSLCVLSLLADGGLRSKAELLLSLVLLRVLPDIR